MELMSSAFDADGPIPVKYSCDGEDKSPPLSWAGVPEGTVSLTLIVDDPDAPVGTWVHWVLYDIPGDVDGLPEGLPDEDELTDGSRHGKNSWGRRDYGGPCPPGGTHRYFFKLYALDTKLGLRPGAGVKQVTDAMEGHVLAEARLMGTYGR